MWVINTLVGLPCDLFSDYSGSNLTSHFNHPSFSVSSIITHDQRSFLTTISSRASLKRGRVSVAQQVSSRSACQHLNTNSTSVVQQLSTSSSSADLQLRTSSISADQQLSTSSNSSADQRRLSSSGSRKRGRSSRPPFHLPPDMAEGGMTGIDIKPVG